MTSSSGRSRRPSNRRAYRSSTRPALAAKAGSRTNSHERCCQGLIASSASQRQIVAADASVTPRSTTSRCSSVREKRPSGRPCVAGNSQAIALTSATCSGGKTARATRTRLVLQPLKAPLGESSPPAPDQTRRRVEPRRDLRVGHTIRGVEHDPRPLHLLERQLLRPSRPLKHTPLIAGKLNPMPGPTRHRYITSPAQPRLLQHNSGRYFRPRLLATPQGRAMADVTAVFAELERALIAQRTAEALGELRAQRRIYGPVPLPFDVAHRDEQQAVTLARF